MSTNPEIFDKIDIAMDESWQVSFDLVTKIYNNCLERSENILSAFQRQREIVKAKGAKFYSVYDEVGKLLNEGKTPTMNHLFSVRSTLR